MLMNPGPLQTETCLFSYINAILNMPAADGTPFLIWQRKITTNRKCKSMYQLHFHTPIPIHFIGIGGISMSGLAEILLKESFPVSGSDSHASALTDHLASLGAQIFIGQKASNIPEDCQLVVYTAAIHPDNPEYAAAKQRGIPN